MRTIYSNCSANCDSNNNDKDKVNAFYLLIATPSNTIRRKVVPVDKIHIYILPANDYIFMFLFCVLFLQESILLLDEKDSWERIVLIFYLFI